MRPSEPYALIAQRLGGRMIGLRTLTGGVSADVRALELVGPDGHARRVVVRRHRQPDFKPDQAGIADTEFALLTALSTTGLPVDRPLLLDTSGAIVPDPYLVLPFVEGTTEIERDALPDAVNRMARFLVELHRLDPTALALPALPDCDDPMPIILKYLPRTPDLLTARAHLETAPRCPPAPRRAVLHCDVWPGNVIWRAGRIAAVIDWEDAALGDPLADLAGSRIELTWMYGPAAAATLTARYAEHAGIDLDPMRLALWDLHAASAALAYMHSWGLPPDRLAAMDIAGRAFLRRAAQVVVGAR